MGHPGKHPIDPDTGLCDVCDSSAIEDIRQGRKPQKRTFYGPDDKPLVENVMDEPFYPGFEDDIYYDEDRDQTIRYEPRRIVREHPVQHRRRVIQETPEEKPFYVRRRPVPAAEYYEEELPIPPRPRRRGPMVEEVIVRRPIQPKTFYYVDQGGQRVPRLRSPPGSPHPSYVARGAPRIVSRPVYELPPVTPPSRRRVVQVIRRRRRTPSPVTNPTYDAEPPRLVRSDSDVFDQPVQRQQQRPISERTPESPLIPAKVTMYHIDASSNDGFNQLESYSSNSSNDDRRLSPRDRPPYALDNRRPAKLTQNGRESPSRIHPTVIRRSYRTTAAANDEQIVGSPRPTNGQINRNVRRNLNNQPDFYPRSDNRNNPRNAQRKDPSVYYMQSSNRP